MSLLAELEVSKGSKKPKKRVGRGDGSGHGSTAGGGHKGQLQRSGGRVRRGFEGGQTPLTRRLPKFGFNPINKTNYQIFNLKDLANFGAEVSPEVLYKLGKISKDEKIKILGVGQLQKAITVKAHSFSASAKAAIEAAGGKAEVI